MNSGNQTKFSNALLLLLLAIAPRFAFAQPATTKATVPAPSGLEDLRAKGADALFNLDYDAARETFKQISQLFPDEPVGSRLLAWTIWLETMNRSRLRKGAIYSTQSFTATPDDKPDPKIVQEFRNLTRRAEQLAQARLKPNPRDAQELAELGSVETLEASFEATAEKRYLAALRDAASGIDREREAIKLDPSLHDAELPIGLYDYVLGNLPLSAKLVASLMGARGSKKRGVQTLERVAQEGHWERDYAKLLLITLYKYQKRFADSLTLSRELQEKYPHNYLFKLETADSLISQAGEERRPNQIVAAAVLQKESVSIFESLLNESATPRVADRAIGLIHFRYGEALLALGQPERAAQQFLAATKVHNIEAELITRAHLRAGQSFDLAGRRNEALAEYRIVIARPNIDGLQEQARRGLNQPFKAK